MEILNVSLFIYSSLSAEDLSANLRGIIGLMSLIKFMQLQPSLAKFGSFFRILSESKAKVFSINGR